MSTLDWAVFTIIAALAGFAAWHIIVMHRSAKAATEHMIQLPVVGDWVTRKSILAVDYVPFIVEKRKGRRGPLVIVTTTSGPILIDCDTHEHAQAVRDQIAAMANGEPAPKTKAPDINRELERVLNS